MRQHPAGRRLAVGAGDRPDRNPRLRAGREQHFQHLAGHIARRAFGRCHMHPKARGRVHLDNRPTDVLVAFRDVRRQEIHAPHIKAHGLDGAFGHVLVVGVADIGHVDGRAAGGQVGGGPQKEGLAFRQHRRCGVSGLLHQPFGLGVKFKVRQHLFMADAAPGVRVHDLHQFGDGLLAVADHMPGHALGDGHQLVVHHQHAVIHAGDKAFDKDRPAFGLRPRLGKGGLDLCILGQVDRHAAPVVAVQGLHHHRKPDPLRRAHRFGRGIDDALLRHRQAQVVEHVVRVFLVAGNLDRDVLGLAGDRGLNTLLVLAMAELDQRLVVQPDPGDVAFFGRLDQRGGRGAKLLALR